MTYEDISRVNSEMDYLAIEKYNKKTGKTEVKDYAMVPERVTAFRKLYPDGFINTQILSHESGVVLMQAQVGYYDENRNPVILATGMAQEDQSKGMINGTSYIENCETSAVGRALGMIGLGLNGGGICSAEELANAITAQKQMQNEKPQESMQEIRTRVQQTDKVPPVKKEEKTPLSEVEKYLLDSMKNMREMRGISPKENGDLFKAQKEALVKKGLAPNKPSSEYTMQEALALVDAMYRCFDPLGTELKTE